MYNRYKVYFYSREYQIRAIRYQDNITIDKTDNETIELIENAKKIGIDESAVLKIIEGSIRLIR